MYQHFSYDGSVLQTTRSMAYYNVKSGSTVYLDLLPVKNEIDAGKLLKNVSAFWATSGARRYISGSYGPSTNRSTAIDSGTGTGQGLGSVSVSGGVRNERRIAGDGISKVVDDDDDDGRRSVIESVNASMFGKGNGNGNRNDNSRGVNSVNINATSNITGINTRAAVDDINSSVKGSSALSLRETERNGSQEIVTDAILNSTINDFVSTSISTLAVNADMEPCTEQFEECAENDDYDDYED